MSSNNGGSQKTGNGFGAEENLPVRARQPHPASYPQDFPFDDLTGVSDLPEKSLRDYVSILFRRLGLIAAIVLSGILIAALYAYSVVPVYLSAATIEVSMEQPDSIGVSKNSRYPSWISRDDYYTTQVQILKSRAVAQGVADQLLLDQPQLVRTPPRRSPLSRFWQRLAERYWPAGDKKTVETPKVPSEQALVGGILGDLSAEREGQGSLILLSLTATDPVLARELLKSHITVYAELNLKKSRIASQKASQWVSSELGRAKKKLVTSLAELVKFTSDRGMLALDDRYNHYRKFFDSAAEGLVKSKEQRVQLEAILDNNKPGISVLPPEVNPLDLQKLREKLSLLEAEYSELDEIYTANYPKVSILRKKIEFLREKIDNLEKNAVEAALDSAKKQERMHREVFDAAKKQAIDVNTLGVQYALLKKEVEINEQLYQILLKKSKEIELNALTVGNNVSVVDPPSTNPWPVKPKRSLILVLGTCFGLLGGVLAALLLEQMDVKVRTALEIEKKLSVPSLGLVPDIRKYKKFERFNPDKADFPFLSHDAPTAMVSDAVRNVKTSLLLASPVSTIETLVVASALAGEGKTFIAVSIATAMSSGNKRVLVVDADLRNPSLAGIFGQPSNRPGLANLLAGDSVDLSQVIRRSRVPGLYYVPAGPIPPNPAELLESERLPQILSRFSDTFDFVIFDAPPIMGFSDVQLISANVDGVLLVVQQGRVPMDILQEAKNLVTMTRGRIFGAVLNMTDGVFPHYYGGKRYHYYGNHRQK